MVLDDEINFGILRDEIWDNFKNQMVIQKSLLKVLKDLKKKEKL